MKPQIAIPPDAKKNLITDRPLERQIAKNTAELQRIHRTLQVMSTWHRQLLHAIKELPRRITHDAERRYGAAPRKQLAELFSRHDSLTPREREVMALVVKGSANKQIAAQLGTAEITVKVHRASVMKKMKADSIANLVRMAEEMRTGLR